ncbi:hypothetical protein D6D13_02041 [Aureobasidium pullulans]|uniref:Histidine kinase HHK3p n=1 Tax=Aureobasidium pullulans TaxID=5580 RepID=A0A4S9D9D1_AURPU|nr:hypothetical protein D6D13_02041 [Aureobasidium pullulans]
MPIGPLLVALAQNGVFRLACEFASVSLIDQGFTQTIVAEAIPSTSLFDSPHHVLDKGDGTSSPSIAVFNDRTAEHAVQTYDLVANTTRRVVRDMRSLGPYNQFSHVLGPPHMVSLVEVPIRNSSGQLLGTYAIMDNKIRQDFFLDETIQSLTDIANAIADLLQLSTPAALTDLLQIHTPDAPRIIGQMYHTPHSDDSSLTEQLHPETGTPQDDPPLTPSSEVDDFAFPATTPSSCSSASDPAIEGVKSDFISSISHELRSPLHGCLAAVEFLQDTKLDDTQAELIEMIQSCASTLLDTLNHLLDFLKVNEHKSPNLRLGKHHKTHRLKHTQNTFGSSTDAYLCTIVQDVIEGVHFGQSSQQAAYIKAKATPIDNLAFSTHTDLMLDDTGDEGSILSAKAAGAVAVYLDIQNHAGWCTTLPAGAWKRLVMNLFANALKFTSEGFIEISMKLVEDEVSKQSMVHLMIYDTGLGMGEEYMKHHLYQPFIQENPLVSGVGLGLSIVKQIVDDLGGTISVESKPGFGTMFDILVPLCEQDAQCWGKIPSGGEILDPNAVLKGLTVCLLWPMDLQPRHTDLYSRRISVMHSYVRSIAEGWFGMKIVTASATAQVEADIYIAEALHFSEEDTKYLKLSRRPTILVGPLPAAQTRNNNSQNDTIRLAYPLGPKSLGRALFAALDNPVEPGHPHEAIDLEPLSASEAKLMQDLQDCNLEQQPATTSTRAEQIQLTDIVKSEHVLLVDDNAINLKLLAAYVKRLGISAELAVDGKDAFEKYQAAAQRKPFTTILMDISMPVMNGFESSRAIREHEAAQSISSPVRIIALTGLGSDASKSEAELSGMDDFRTKPVALKTLKILLNA